MEIIAFFESEQQQHLTGLLRQCDWSAARFLVDLLEKGRFFDTLGGYGDIYMLMDGEKLVSFATLSGQDSVRDESLQPWSGFVFTVPEYRGHRYAGKVLAHIEAQAAKRGFPALYIATDHVGLYEKYGYQYRENRIDCWGSDQRVLCKPLSAPEGASICGLDCAACSMKSTCSGCRDTGGKPFGGECMVAKCCSARKNGDCGDFSKNVCALKQRLIGEFNALGIADLPQVTDLYALVGGFVNLEYTLPGGQKAKFWDDKSIYLGNQLPKVGTDRCYGLTANEDYLLVCEYGEGGRDANIVVFKKR